MKPAGKWNPRTLAIALAWMIALAWAICLTPGAGGARADPSGPSRLAQAETPSDSEDPTPREEDGEPEQPAEADEPAHAQKNSDQAEFTPPQVVTDPAVLPFPARRMRELLIEAATSGEIERLRPYIGTGDDMTMLSFGGISGDPIDFLKSVSGDPEGHEILAILLEVLQMGFVHIEAGTENEMFVWPYFYAMPLERLTPQQRVELFTLLTYGDYEEMLSFGAYFFYRVGITPAGRWRFFVAGD